MTKVGLFVGRMAHGCLCQDPLKSSSHDCHALAASIEGLTKRAQTIVR